MGSFFIYFLIQLVLILFGVIGGVVYLYKKRQSLEDEAIEKLVSIINKTKEERTKAIHTHLSSGFNLSQDSLDSMLDSLLEKENTYYKNLVEIFMHRKPEDIEKCFADLQTVLGAYQEVTPVVKEVEPEPEPEPEPETEPVAEEEPLPDYEPMPKEEPESLPDYESTVGDAPPPPDLDVPLPESEPVEELPDFESKVSEDIEEEDDLDAEGLGLAYYQAKFMAYLETKGMNKGKIRKRVKEEESEEGSPADDENKEE